MNLTLFFYFPSFFGVALSVIYVPVHNRRSSYLCALIAATVRHTHTAVNIHIYAHVCVFYSAPPLACLPAFIICKFQLFAQIRRTRSANNSNNNNNLLLLLLCSTLHYYHHRLHYGKSGIALLALAPLPRAGHSCLRRSVAERQTFNSISVPRSLLVALCVCVCVCLVYRQTGRAII